MTIDKIPFNGLTHALHALVHSDARSATVYLSPTTRVTASHIRKPGARHLGHTIAVTYGRLNWAGQLFAAKCKRLGVPLPLNDPQLKPWPKPRARKRGKRHD